MKIFKYIFLMLLILSFGGCSNVVQPEPRIVTVTEKVEVLVPTKMKRPKIDCDFKGVGTEPIGKLVTCLTLVKRALEEVTIE